MLKWKIMAAIGFAFGVAGILWGYAQEKKAPGFYELRVYTAQPGKRDALAEAFAAKTAGIFAKHGVTNVGYWIPKQSDPELGISAENTFTERNSTIARTIARTAIAERSSLLMRWIRPSMASSPS